MTQPADLIDALNGTFGRHKNTRASHAKGVAVAGRFLPATGQDTVDVPFLNTTHKVSARFSVGGGKPNISDKSPTVRGIGLTIGKGPESWTLALISAPVFFANSAAQFKAFLAARVPDPQLGGPNPEKVKAFNAANQNTLPHQAFLKSTPPCACYTQEHYHSGHAYGFSQNGDPIWGRIMLEAEGGRKALTEDQQASYPDDFLADALDSRLRTGAARWVLKLRIANEGDTLQDPTTPWEGDHAEILLGTLEIDSRDDSDTAQARVFDPSVVADGIIPPRDQVFDLRSAAYSVSYERRQE